MLRATMKLRRMLVPLALVFGVAALVGCAVTFISPYDEVTDRGVTALQSRVDSVTTLLERDPTPEYGEFKGNYSALRSDLARLQFRNEARPKNSLTVRQLGELKSELEMVETMHGDKRLNPAVVKIQRNILDQTLRAILRLELEKKELKKSTQ